MCVACQVQIVRLTSRSLIGNHAEREVASDPGDFLFLEDNQTIEGQIATLSFEFAKADAVLAVEVPSQHNVPTAVGPPTSDLAHFIELKNRSEQQREKILQEVATLVIME
jgi:hypothetical protein